jgi:glycerate kinase
MPVVTSSSVLGAMDKFRGTASARELSDTVVRAARDAGVKADGQPMSDGGEGFRDAFSGDEVVVEVPGPLGETVSAGITVFDTPDGRQAVLEVAEVIGRARLRSPSRDEALRATSAGAGHLLLAAQRLGVTSVLVGCGGSATSDGGLGCYQVVKEGGGLTVPVTVATDVTARFSGLRRYARQKGIRPGDLENLDERLAQVRELYVRERGVDVELLDRTGASGGIPAALAALGAELTSGFEAVARAVSLEGRVDAASLVVTGEGRLDAGSLEGKVVVGVAQFTRVAGLLVICGSVETKAAEAFRNRFPRATVVSLVQRFGARQARSHVIECVALVVSEEIARRQPEGPRG